MNKITDKLNDVLLRWISGLHHNPNLLRNIPLAEKMLYPIAFYGSGIGLSLLCDWDDWALYSMMLPAPWLTLSLFSLAQLYHLGLSIIPWGVWRLPLAVASGFVCLKYELLSRSSSHSNNNDPDIPLVQSIGLTILYLFSLWTLGDSRLLIGALVIGGELFLLAILNQWGTKRYTSKPVRLLTVAAAGLSRVSNFIFGILVPLVHVLTWTWQWWELVAVFAIPYFLSVYLGMELEDTPTTIGTTRTDTSTASSNTRETAGNPSSATRGTQADTAHTTRRNADRRQVQLLTGQGPAKHAAPVTCRA